MAQYFRLHDGANVVDWGNSGAYDKNIIKGIQDPTGTDASREITSIPSPFARIDLARVAFEKVAQSNLDGNTAYHKLVSDSLDVAEILFNYHKFANQFHIIHWNAKSDLATLLQSPLPEHQLLGQTLATYLQQDAQSYNFGQMQSIYMLQYIGGGPQMRNIVGGTSPASLFFASANDLSYTNIKLGDSRAFDNDYQPLYRRDPKFVQFMFVLQNALPNFAGTFPTVHMYLEETRKILPQDTRIALQPQNLPDYTTHYNSLSVTGQSGLLVEVLGTNLLSSKPDTGQITQSDFMLAPTKGQVQGNLPLVLPNGIFNAKLQYVSHPWPNDNSIKVPHKDDRELAQRVLPDNGEIYPYWTTSDILEPYLIQTVYSINAQKFFTGNYKGFDPSEASYLLPLKREVFDYFSAEDIQGYVNGEEFIELRKTAGGGVLVTVRIPIKCGRNIVFTREYTPQMSETRCAEVNEYENRGAIIRQTFSLAIYPFLKALDTPNFYRVLMIDRDIQAHNKHNQYEIEFNNSASNNVKLRPMSKQMRSKKSDSNISTDHYVLEGDFDYLEVRSSSNACGVVVPKMPKVEKGGTQYRFAVDFGTTNTHIEYQAGQTTARPFDITSADMQVVTLHSDLEPEQTILQRIILQELLPPFIGAKDGKTSEFRFPTRTAITHSKKLNYDKATYAMADLNLSMIYEKVAFFNNQEVQTNLKWSDFSRSAKDQRQIEAYLESILFMIRNKVLLNGGDLDATKLVWFYPSSMSIGKRNKLEGLWRKLYAEYINKTNTPIKLSESIAPFYYYKNREGVTSSARPVVSIDIGGGTTDIVIFKNNVPLYQTSARFAANSIFGDGYGCSTHTNGFIKLYHKQITDKLRQNTDTVGELSEIMSHIEQRGVSAELIAFYFSLEHHPKIVEHNLPISFSKLLADDDKMRIVFFMFYGAVIYHIAKLMRSKELDPPTAITFSGTGSKILTYMDQSAGLTSLGALTAMIFEQVGGVKDVQIRIYPNNHPKEITCQGGLMLLDKESEEVVDAKNEVFIASAIDKPIEYDQLEESAQYVLADFDEFLSVIEACHKKMSFVDHFNVDATAMSIYQQELKTYAEQHLRSGIEERLKDQEDQMSNEVKESPFFYILVGGLNGLSSELAKKA